MAVKCPKCRSDNPETSKFCADCGMRLIRGHEPDSHKPGSVSPELSTETLQAPSRDYPPFQEILKPKG